jgi:hypothetical protein
MQVRPASELRQKASALFEELDKNYRPCEALYILSEMMKMQSLAMLQREREEAISDTLTRSLGTTRVMPGGEI